MDGFDSAPARSNVVDRPGRTFVERPTGLRPGSPQLNPTEAPVARPALSRELLAREATGKAEGPVDPKPTPSGPPVVAIFDGGVDTKHTDLDGALWTNPGEVEGDGIDNDGNGVADDIHGFNVGFNTGDPFKGDGTDHGTHVAGIIAAEDNGQGNTGVAAGKAQVLSVGGLYDGNDLLTNFERSVDYVVGLKEKGANIRAVDASFGDEYKDAASQARWKAAIQKLADADILLVAATANGNGSNMNNVQDFPSESVIPQRHHRGVHGQEQRQAGALLLARGQGGGAGRGGRGRAEHGAGRPLGEDERHLHGHPARGGHRGAHVRGEPEPHGGAGEGHAREDGGGG